MSREKLLASIEQEFLRLGWGKATQERALLEFYSESSLSLLGEAKLEDFYSFLTRLINL